MGTYQQEVDVTLPVRPLAPGRKVLATFPSYWDPVFVEQKRHLVKELGRRFDGNSTISKVRIDTGIVTEDNPTFDGLRNAMPGWSNERWIAYCGEMVKMYREAFPRSDLEFDIDRLGWIAAKGPSEKALVDALLAKMESMHVFLAMDGLDSKNVSDWRSRQKSGPAFSLQYVAMRHLDGFEVGLEGAPLFLPPEHDVESLAKAYRDIGASRLVLFSDAAAMVNLRREGANSQNHLWSLLLSPSDSQLTASNSLYLLTQLHFTP